MVRLDLKLIKQRREELEFPLQEMAAVLGFKNASNYHKYEKGEYQFNANHLPQLADKLQLSIIELFSVS